MQLRTCPAAALVGIQDTRTRKSAVYDRCRKVCHLQGSARINVLQGGQGLRGQHWDRMQLAASQAHVAGVQSLPTRLQITSTRSVWRILLQHP